MMNTVVAITVFADDTRAGEKAIAAAFARMESVVRLMDRHLPDSEVSRCNREAAEKPVKVSPETFEVLRRSREASALTDGAFDITVTPFITLWGECARKGAPPTAEQLQQAKERVGYDKLLLDEEERTVRFARPGMALDLGGIAKGYAVDAAIAALKEAGIKAALVDAGGDIYVMGLRPNNAKWIVGIQDPLHPESPQDFARVLEVSDVAATTSGNYRRFSEIAGRRYSHIIDPRTGLTADAVPSVTVMARDATTADALATGLSVLGVEAGLKLVQKLQGVEALLVTVEDGKLVLHASPGFARYLKK